MPDVLARKMARIFPLSSHELDVLRELPVALRSVSRGRDLIVEGDRPNVCTLVMEGFACRYKLAADGKRQILAFLVPGDFCDLQSFLLDVMDHGIATLTVCRLGTVPHRAIRDITEAHPRIARAFWKDTLIDASTYRERMTFIARQMAYARIANLICEIRTRLMPMGLVRGKSLPWPITQSQVGDALGISSVHVNRTFQQLKAAGLISHKKAELVINNWKGLQDAGEFSGKYLHLIADSPSEQA